MQYISVEATIYQVFILKRLLHVTINIEKKNSQNTILAVNLKTAKTFNTNRFCTVRGFNLIYNTIHFAISVLSIVLKIFKLRKILEEGY